MALNGHTPWGVLVGRTVPSVENGLLSLLEIKGGKNMTLNRVNDSGADNLWETSTKLIIPLQNESIRIGRMRCNDITISNPCISSVHCSITIMRKRNVDADNNYYCTRAVDEQENSEHLNNQALVDDAVSVVDNVLVTFSDYSRNGCSVNGITVGKAKHVLLRSRDILSLIDAGRRTSDYNVCFHFFSWVDFVHEYQTIIQPPSIITHPPVSSSTALQQKRKRQFLLVSAWNAIARARRMYFHSVDDFYLLDRSAPLGEGAFGKVFRAALRPSQFRPFDQMETGQLDSVSDRDQAELTRQKMVYIKKKEMIPSRDIIQATQRAAEYLMEGQRKHPLHSDRKRLRESAREEGDVELEATNILASSVCYCFAVKLIQKQRLGVEEDGSSYSVLGTKRVCISDKEKDCLVKLMELETPIEAYEEQWVEKNFREELDKANSSFSFSQEPSISQVNKFQNEADGTNQWNKNSVMCFSREAEKKRTELLGWLSPGARQLYQRARRTAERQKREVDILISLSHPNIVRLYEVFDFDNQLALVMEQATGGEVWDLLQPPKRVEPFSGEKMPLARGVAMEKQVGGPLPEFVVKIIITQVIKAVKYLHSMGVIHRDLKLENLLLKTPISIRQLVALQCEMLQHKIASLLLKRKEISSFFEDGESNPKSTSTNWREQLQCNPLSPLYTVHLPPSLWPVVQITDFGLSHIIKSESNEAVESDDEKRWKEVYNRHVLQTNCGTRNYTAPEVLHKAYRSNKEGYSASADMFSVGVIAFALLTNRLPYAPDKSTGVVDYSTPLCFQRARFSNSVSGVSRGTHYSFPALPNLATFSCGAKNDCESEQDNCSSRKEMEGRVNGTEASISKWEKDCLLTGLQFYKISEDGPTSAANIFIREVSDLRDALRKFTSDPNSTLDLDTLLVSQIVEPQESRRFSEASRVSLCDVSPHGQNFLTSLLTPYPTRRLGAGEALQHPWLRECVSMTDT